MSRKTNLDKFNDVLFKDFDEQQHLTLVERDQLKRYRATFTQSLVKPSIPDNQLRDFLISEFGISTSQAYRNIANVRILLGNVRNAVKEWIRYLVKETLKQAIEDASDKRKLKERIMAAAMLAKYNRLDKEDIEKLPWDEIVPEGIEPTTDPTVLKIKPLKNKKEEIRSVAVYYREWSSIENIELLGKKYIAQMKRDLPPLVFQTSIMCIRLGKLKDGFYPALSEKNTFIQPLITHTSRTSTTTLKKPQNRIAARMAILTLTNHFV